VTFYRTNEEHLADTLRWLDLLLRLRVMQCRWRPLIDERADGSIDSVFNPPRTPVEEPPETSAIRERLDTLRVEIDARVAESARHGVSLALPCVARIFALSTFETNILVICLAPELDRKYCALYAYLQNDIARNQPTVDLALQLLCDSEPSRWCSRALFSDDTTLFREQLLHKTHDRHSGRHAGGLAQPLSVDERILNYILGDDGLDARLQEVATLVTAPLTLDEVFVEPRLKTQISEFVRAHLGKPSQSMAPMALYFYGPYGAGHQDLALALTRQWQRPLLCVDMERLLTQGTDGARLLRLAGRESRLQGAALFLDHVDSAFQEDDKRKAAMAHVARVATDDCWLTFLAGENPWPLQGPFGQTVFHAFSLAVPGVSVRQAACERALRDLAPEADITWAAQVAGRFRLTPGQIYDAVAWAVNHRAMQGTARDITIEDLFAGCRYTSNRKLAELAQHVSPRYTWQDIVLSEDKLNQLREICSHVTQRHRVFEAWGFDRTLAHGKGLSVLFAGPSGTGKTMAAEIMAHALQVDLYKIDLSGIVSKYIGETEKNLSRIFWEAESSNAVLFFDEADAVFAKRTRISDAHDRYANIETSYLLQKMEEYEGIVILATNLRENMDDAFIRRMRFIVDFAFPDAASRAEIWQRHFPREMPVMPDLDYAWLAKQFQVSGGNIRNIVLHAAFYAAENGGRVGMQHIISGARREFEKIGKLWSSPHAAIAES
jgi:SpoVK/Ycf46/Vps4 family AAA+-type ATPase